MYQELLVHHISFADVVLSFHTFLENQVSQGCLFITKKILGPLLKYGKSLTMNKTGL